MYHIVVDRVRPFPSINVQNNLDVMSQTQTLTKLNKKKDRQRLINAFGLLLSVSLVVVFCIFMRSPLSGGGGAEAPPRGTILLQPLLNPEFLDNIWFGVDLPQSSISGERWLAFLLGAFAVIGTTALGRIAFTLFKGVLRPSRGETLFFSGTLGLTLLSTYSLALGLCGKANGRILPLLSIGFIVGVALLVRAWTRRVKVSPNSKTPIKRPSSGKYGRLRKYLQPRFIPQATLVLFCSFYIFAATQPIFEYDALEYHIQGAREIYETGKITFVPHNVYANMPLGIEQYYVVGFNLARDLGYDGQNILRIGSLIGKTIISSLALLTALGLVCFCRRFFPRAPNSGVFSALLYLSIPGIFDVFSNGLNECALALVILALTYALLLSLRNRNSNCFLSSSLLGCFAGLAISTKYTGVVFITTPFLLFLAFVLRWKRNSCLKVLTCVLLFTSSAALIGGGWYARNFMSTGNPVYPLAYSVFGDSTNQWNPEIDARWKKAHSSSEFGVKAALDASNRVVCGETLSSPFSVFIPFVFAVPIIGLVRNKFKTANLGEEDLLSVSFVLLTILYALCWFFGTHRLTRFLLPITPIVVILFGVHVSHSLSSVSKSLKITVCSLSLLSLLYSGLIIDIVGQGRMAPLRSLERDPMRFAPASIFFNDRPEVLQVDAKDCVQNKLLLVGDAKAAAFRVPVLYSTCWNNSPIMPILNEGVVRNDDGQIVRVEDPNLIIENFHKAGVSFIYVDFNEITRFTSPGNYGINNPELTSSLFMLLEQSGVLKPYFPDGIESLGPGMSQQRIFKVLPNDSLK